MKKNEKTADTSRGENPNDVSNFLLFNFQRNEFYKAHIKLYKSQKSLYIKDYLPAFSIATRAGAVIPSLKGVTMIFGIPMPCEKDK